METKEKVIEEPYGFIYITTNMVNGKRYLGQKKIGKNNSWKNYLGSGTKFREDVKIFGKENFLRNIVCICYSPEELNMAEYEMSIFLNVVESDDWYNLCYGGGTICGFHHSDETKQKISAAQTGEKHWAFGTHHTEEWRQYMSQILIGKPRPDDVREKISNGLKGKYTGAKNSRYGKPRTEEEKRKISDGHQRVKVICIDTGVLYKSIQEAHRITGIDPRNIAQAIHKHCRAGGYYWDTIEHYKQLTKQNDLKNIND